MKKVALLSLALVMIFLSAAVIPLAPAVALPDPDAPYDLTVNMVTPDGIILLDWDCDSAIYQTATVMRKENGASTWEELDTVHETSYSDDATVLMPGTIYDYQIKNDAGSSATVSVVREDLTIKTPEDLTGEAISAQSIQISWTNPNPFPTYTHVAYTRHGHNDTTEQLVDPGITTATITGLGEDTAYDFVILAYTTYESSDSSTALTVKTLKAGSMIVPNAPSNLTAEALHSDEILLNWTDTSNNEVGFEIFRQEGANGTMELLTTLNADVSTHSDAPLSPNTTYYYQMRAINTDGESAFSNKASATTPGENQAASMILKFYIGSTQYLVNGEAALLDSPPIAIENRTMLPIRYVVEPLGGTAAWDPVDKKATINCNGHTLILWLNNNLATVDGASKLIDDTNLAVVPLAANNRILMPLRFVGENLDCGVEWNGGTSEAVITYPDPGL